MKKPTTGQGAGREAVRDRRHGQGRPPRPGTTSAGIVALAVLTLLAGACSPRPKSPAVAGSGLTTTTQGASSPGRQGAAALVEMTAYSKCMRAHGISDFPDPTPGPGGKGGSFQIDAGPGSDLNPNNPRNEEANKACQSLLPDGGTASAPSSAQLAAEVKLAACMRTHGFPAFPDPNGQGAFLLHNFDMSAPPVQAAFKTCDALTKFTGPMRVGIQTRAPKVGTGHRVGCL